MSARLERLLRCWHRASPGGLTSVKRPGERHAQNGDMSHSVRLDNGSASPGTAPLSAASDTDQARLVSALQKRLAGASKDNGATVIETHISYVLVAGGFAYKIKKAVNL